MRMCVIIPLFWSLMLAAIAPSTSLADDVEDSDSEVGYFKKHFQLHGYFTLAYADLNLDDPRVNTGNEIILGIPEDGTGSYGNAAIFVRYRPMAKHTFILQLSGRRLGDSPVDEVEDSVELDWLFYQYQPTDRTRLRLGRVPAPAGIFNEIRDVGVLLPFYRPPYVFYREGSVFSETVDGLAISHSFLPARKWSLDADIYYGDHEVLEQGVGFSSSITEVDVSDALGAQVWLDTPFSGLRLGLGAQRWDVGAESSFNFEETTWRSWYVSVDGVFEHFVARAELRHVETTAQSSRFLPVTDAELDLYYLQLGWLATERLGFYFQPEISDVNQSSRVFVGGRSDFREREDIGLSVVFKLRPNFALKGEYHAVRSESPLNDVVVPGPGGPRVLRTYQDFDSDYSIISLSVSL